MTMHRLSDVAGATSPPAQSSHLTPLFGLALLLAAQWLGEMAQKMLGAPVPGQVMGIGIVMLFMAVPILRPSIRQVARPLLSALPLLLLPIAASLIDQAALIRTDMLAIGITVIVTTVLTMLVTHYVFATTLRLTESGDRA